MRFKNFIGGSYKLNSVNAACERTLNLFYVINEAGTATNEEVGYLTNTPGLDLLINLPTLPIRAVYTSSKNKLYAVAGNTLYEIAPDFLSYTLRGTLTTSTGTVSFSDNGFFMVLVDGTNGYTLEFATNTFATIADVDFIPSYFVKFISGYFVFPTPNTGQFQYSGIYNTDFEPLDFQTAEGSPDNIVSIETLQNELWTFGEKTIEVFYVNTGSIDNAFQRNQSGFIEYGCVAPYSVVKLANTLFWLGRDDNGSGQIYLANGYLPQRISTFAIEQAIQSYDVISDAIAFGYQQGGHNFYVLNFPAADATWVFDQTTQQWHERGTTDTNGVVNRFRINYHSLYLNQNIAGDAVNNSIYRFNLETYTENGDIITRIRTSPHIAQDMKYIFYKSFQLDIESGVGLSVASDVQGYDPQAVLTWSNDAGHSWSNEYALSMGKIGEYKKRLIWRKLGRARNRVWSIKITEPVKVVILGAEFDAVQGSS